MDSDAVRPNDALLAELPRCPWPSCQFTGYGTRVGTAPFSRMSNALRASQLSWELQGFEEYLQPVRLRSSPVVNLSVIQMYHQFKC